MSKTVKTIGLLGLALFAMLGTKAEAHYMYASGRYYYHSVGCEVTIGDFPPSSPDPLVVGCAVTTAQVEAKCSTGSIVNLSIEIGLSNQENVAPGVSDVEVIVDDVPLLTNPSILSACALVGGTAIDVLIRSTLIKVTIQCIGPSLSCLTPLVPTSTAMATYNLPAGCTLDKCPNSKREYTMVGIVTHAN